jgi:hypothetical protein
MRRSVSIGLLLAVWLTVFVRTASATTAVQYVSVDGNDANNGLAWTTPKATVSAAISALPSQGGTVWVASPGSTGMALGMIDPASRSLDLILGCSNNYTADQIVLRNNFHLTGCGSNNANPGTVITATGTHTDLIALGGSSPIAGVWLQGFRIDTASSSNSLNGIHIAAQANGGGLWYSTFTDLMIGCGATSCVGFGGVGLDFDGSAGGSPKGLNQFISVRDVRVFRNSSSLYACQWLGANGQFVMDNVECDGPGGSVGTNINIASTSGTLWPYSLSFNELTTEAANLAVNISGAASITFHQAHLETDHAGFLLSAGTGGVNTYGITIEDSEFMSGFVNGGAGFLVKTTTGPTNSNLSFLHNRIGPTPDNFFIGFTTNLSEVGTLLGGGTYRTSTIQGLTVDGNLVVTGTKSAGVTLPDGRSVALYAVESPENWFEDFGTAQLTSGRTTVQLDKDFLGSVDTQSDGYHVFLTANGACGSVYVSQKSSTGFEVRRLGNKKCNESFDYRVIAKRRGFEKVRMETIREPEPK